MKKLLLALSSAALSVAPALAATADRLKPVNMSSVRGGEIDFANGRAELAGDVLLTQGSMRLTAETALVRKTPDGFYQARAMGSTARQVSFHQDRDVAGAAVVGAADQLEFDGRAEVVRFVGNASMRQMRGTRVDSEARGACLVYDKRTDVLTLQAGAPHGARRRVHLVLMPPAKPDDLPALSPLQLQPTLTLRTPN